MSDPSHSKTGNPGSSDDGVPAQAVAAAASVIGATTATSSRF